MSGLIISSYRSLERVCEDERLQIVGEMIFVQTGHPSCCVVTGTEALVTYETAYSIRIYKCFDSVLLTVFWERVSSASMKHWLSTVNKITFMCRHVLRAHQLLAWPTVAKKQIT